MIGFFVFILGLIIGSFLNVLILRLHAGKSILGRSVCVSCQKFICWHDNIPLLSFFMLGGRCRFCKGKISWQYPIIEAATGFIFLLIYLAAAPADLFGYALMIRNFIFASVLIIIFVYDLKWYLILDSVTVPAILFALAANLFFRVGILELIFGVLAGGGFFLAQFLASHGRWIGGGDLRLGALMGAMLGFKLVIAALFIAYIFGAAVGILLIIFKKKKFSSQVPFGTFLAAATIISLIFGEEILNYYLQLP